MSQPLAVLIIGGGGHGKVVIEAARAAGLNPIGVLDKTPSLTTVLGVPVLGGDDLAPELFAKGCTAAFVAIGQNDLRGRIGDRLRTIGFALPTIIHPSAVVSPSASLGVGVVVMPNSVINAAAKIGDFAIINTGAVVEHDCVIGKSSHVAPGAILGGEVTLHEEVFFGIRAVARPRSTIYAHATIGAGAVVVGTIGDGVTAVGVPARPIQRGTRMSSGKGTI